MIQIAHLQKIVDQRTALDLESLQVAAGEVAAVIGPPGSGLETVFDLLTGKLRPSAGTIHLAGVTPAEKDAFSRKVGVLFPGDALYMRQTPEGNLALLCQLYGLPKGRGREVLERIGMADQAGVRLERLPAGLLRRLAFGRAILHHPAVLLLYEPFNRCDEATVALLARSIRQLAGEGAAVLILAGDTANLEAACDRVYQLQQGRLSLLAPAGNQPPALPFKIPVRLEDKVILVNPGEILYIEAEGGHTCLHTAEARLSTQFTLNELEDRLARSGFFRAHRSYLVNLQHIKEIIPYTRNSFSLRLDDPAGTEIPLSKTAAGDLKDLFGY